VIKGGVLPRIRLPKWESEWTGKDNLWTRLDVLYECSNCPGCVQYRTKPADYTRGPLGCSSSETQDLCCA